MVDMQYFHNADFGTIRIHSENGTSWFVASDVCKVLGHSNPTEAMKSLDEDEKAKFNLGLSGGFTNVINESGLYSLVLRSRKSEAKAFRRWVTHEVLPSIRQSGGYMVARDESPEETLARALLIAQDSIDRKNKHIEELEPKAFLAQLIEDSEALILIRDLAHILKQNGADIGERRLFKRLRDDHYLEKHRNEPTQKALDLDVFRVVETTVTKPDGGSLITRTTKVTGKGQVYFTNRYAGIST